MERFLASQERANRLNPKIIQNLKRAILRIKMLLFLSFWVYFFIDQESFVRVPNMFFGIRDLAVLKVGIRNCSGKDQ